MAAVWSRVEAELRRRTRAALLYLLVIGLAGGVALTAVAGARRTRSSMSRFVAYSRSTEVFVGSDDPSIYPRLGALPQVSSWIVSTYLLTAPVDPPALGNGGGGGAIAEIQNAGSYRPHLLAGRMPAPDRVGEALMNASMATQTHLGLGSRIRLRGYGPDDAKVILRGGNVSPTGPVFDVHVVGIGRFPSEISTAPRTPGVNYNGTGFIYLTPAFFRSYGDHIATAGGEAMSARFKHGLSDFPAFVDAVKRIAPDAQVEPGSDDLTAAGKVHRATGIEALALLLFGLVAALVGAALVAQAMARQAFSDGADYPALRAMGMTRRQFVGVASIRGALVGAAGAVIAVVTAYLLSPRMPIGIARLAEVHPGYSFDAPVLVAGGVIIITAITVAAALASWRTVRSAGSQATESPAGSRLADRLARAGAPPSSVLGVRLALEPGRGTTAVPVRTTAASAVLAVTVIVGVLSFGASLNRLATRPLLQGWNWHASVGNPHSDDVSAVAIPKLAGNDDVAGFTGVAGPADAEVEGHRGGLYAIDAVQGSVFPPFTQGRPPRGPDEIAFGATDLRSMHFHVGQEVSVSAGGPPRPMRIVGRVVITPAVLNDQVNLGQAALVTKQGLDALGGQADENVFLVRFKPGVDRVAAMARLGVDFPQTVLPAVRPADVENLRRVDRLPSLLAAIIAVIAMVTVGHMLVTSVRRRRRDIAILRTMGFVARQVASAVAWQATTIVLIGLVVGVPLGIAAGRLTWSFVATQLGVLVQPVVPVLAVILTAAGALVVGNVVASAPGLMAARTRPATILRAE
jgi:FtsX-like permease family